MRRWLRVFVGPDRSEDFMAVVSSPDGVFAYPGKTGFEAATLAFRSESSMRRHDCTKPLKVRVYAITNFGNPFVVSPSLDFTAAAGDPQ